MSGMNAPEYVTVSDGPRWGVARLLRPDDNNWWVDIRRRDLRWEDARDLCDVWNKRGAEKRP